MCHVARDFLKVTRNLFEAQDIFSRRFLSCRVAKGFQNILCAVPATVSPITGMAARRLNIGLAPALRTAAGCSSLASLKAWDTLAAQPPLNVFMKIILIATALIGLNPLIAVRGAVPQPVDEVLPLVGTGGHGHTYPGATVPFGFVQLSPDTPIKGWDACAGYHYSDSSILGFSHTHLSGTGIGDLGDVLVLPITGALQQSANYQALTVDRLRSGFSHDNEFATPGYYRVMLDKYHVLAELTATAHAGMHRYTFPASKESHLLIDLVHGVNNQVTEASLRIENSKMITGQRTTTGWNKNRTIYFAVECSQPWKGFGLEANGNPLPAGQTE